MTIIGSAFVNIRARVDDFADDADRGVLGKIGGIAAKASLLLGGAVAGFGVKAVAEFASFEGKMNEVFTLLPGISGPAIDQMTGQVKTFAKDFGVLPDKVVPALYQALSAGVPQDNVFAFLETAQKAAKGGVTELTTAVDGISSVVNTYGAETVSASKASDLMFTAVRLGKTNFEQLSASLFQVNPIAASLGVKFEDVTAALAALTAKGVPTSVATTQLRQAFVEMSKEGTKTSDLFKEISGKTFKDFIESGGNTQQALALLADHAKETGVGVNDLFGSVEAGAAALALTGDGAKVFADNITAMADSAGATDAAFNQMNRGIGPLFDKVKAFAAVVLIDAGNAIADLAYRLADVLKPALDGIGPIVDSASTAFGILAGVVGNPVFQVAAALIAVSFVPALIALAVQATLTGVALVASYTVFIAQSVIAGVTVVAQNLLMIGSWIAHAVAATANAIIIAAAWLIALGPIALLVAAVIGAAILIIRNWESIKDFIGSAVEAVGGFLSNLIGAIGRLVSSVAEKVGEIIGFFGRLASGVGEKVGEVIGFFGRLVSAVFEKAGELIGVVASIPGRILGALGNLGGILYDAGLAIIRGLRDGIVAGLEAVYNIARGIAGKIASLKGPLPKDRRLLIPAGIAIMEGLQKGLDAKRSALEAQLRDITGSIASVGVSGARTAGGGGFSAGVTAGLPQQIAALTAAIEALASGGRGGTWNVNGGDPYAAAAAMSRQMNWSAGR